MRRLVLVLVVVITALAAGSVLSTASAGAGQATAAAKKCTKTNKKKCKKKTTAVALKDGDYTYKQAAVGSAPVNTLTISGKGTKVRIRELFFSGGEDPGGIELRGDDDRLRHLSLEAERATSWTWIAPDASRSPCRRSRRWVPGAERARRTVRSTSRRSS